jgi:hypothetical protein
MRSLIWKEWRENLKWVPLPGLVILLVFLIDKPTEPMLPTADAYYFCLIAVVFGAALGFVQIFFEAHGDKRSILLHRPMSPSRIFLAKAIAGIGLYVLALGIPFAWLESWFATPGNLAAPYHWRTSLPWLADILSGLVYYFAGMLTAQREARWYGSRGLALAAAFFCSYLVWALPEFWQALLAIGVIGLFVSVAAWGSFCTTRAYAPQPRPAKAALAMTMLLGLLILSMMGKQLIGEWLDSATHYQVDLDGGGQVLFSTSKDSRGPISVIDLNGQEADFEGNRFWRPCDCMLGEWPVRWGYRYNSRFYVGYSNDSKPRNEHWYYDQTQDRLLGYDGYYHHFLGSFGPDGFTPPGQQPGKRFPGKLLFMTNRWLYITVEYLAFPEGVYEIDFARRTIQTLFTPAVGETVMGVSRWNQNGKRIVLVMSTDRSFHIVTEKGAPVVSLPRVLDHGKYVPIFVGEFEKPKRYFVWYHLITGLREPEEYRTEPTHLLEYDGAGRELARRTVPPFPYPAASYADTLYGLATPMTEAATLVATSQYVRSVDRSNGGTQQSSLIDCLEDIQYFIPGTSTVATGFSHAMQPPFGLIPAYIAMILLSAAASALGCFQLARRYAFSRARRIGWSFIGFSFGWVGLILMLVVQEWPARIACSTCRKFRVVTRATCEHCGAQHATPAPDGTEIFESAATLTPVALTAR